MVLTQSLRYGPWDEAAEDARAGDGQRGHGWTSPNNSLYLSVPGPLGSSPLHWGE